MDIKILGTGCPKCKSLEKMTTDTVAELNLEASVSKEEDIMKIKVLLSGRLPSKKEITDLLTQK